MSLILVAKIQIVKIIFFRPDSNVFIITTITVIIIIVLYFFFYHSWTETV